MNKVTIVLTEKDLNLLVELLRWNGGSKEYLKLYNRFNLLKKYMDSR